MTTIICTAAILFSAPCERGGAAIPVPPPRGGQAVMVLHVSELPRYPAWVCIHNHEGAWNDTGDPYWGGLQMDRGFMASYGADMEREHAGEGWRGLGFADAWTPAEQIEVAERAYLSGRGFTPWPNTARACGVL